MVARMVIFVTEGRSSVCGHDIWVAFMIHEERLLYFTKIHHPQPCLSLATWPQRALRGEPERDTCGACKLTCD